MDVQLNHLAIIVAALSDLLVGALWYSPLLFYKPWRDANGFTDEGIKKAMNPAKTYGLTCLFALIISYNLAFFLGSPEIDAAQGALYGLLTGVWAALAFMIVGLFEQRKWGYMLINAGYMLVAFTLKGFIIGAWR